MRQSELLPEVISFGAFHVDRAGGRLLRDRADVPIRGKTFAVLEHLVTRPGELVRKEDLLEAVWPETHVSPGVLTGCIRELRRALGDDARAPRFIETAHRRGYRFIARAVALPRLRGRRTVAAVKRAWDGDVIPDRELARLARWFVRAVAELVGAPHGPLESVRRVAAAPLRRGPRRVRSDGKSAGAREP